ncbi:hypothetical protein Tco_1053661 [Tanacetum coccineum]|uniref:BESS domain-containing protein n=1 Tax=Tanacetum coccineum TaxID=301880 RepID=A0ABQ5GVJ9_9ASTR
MPINLSKNKKNCVTPISIIDFSKEDPFSGSPTIPSDDSFPSSSPVKTSDSTSEEFTDEISLFLTFNTPLGDDFSILKKKLPKDTFRLFQTLFSKIDDNLHIQKAKLIHSLKKGIRCRDKSSLPQTLTSPESK